MHDWLTPVGFAWRWRHWAALFWHDSFDWVSELLAKREALALLPESERRLIDWPGQAGTG